MPIKSEYEAFLNMLQAVPNGLRIKQEQLKLLMERELPRKFYN